MVTALLAGTIAVLFYLAAGRASQFFTQSSVVSEKEFVANAFAMELIEFFRVFRQDQLTQYIRTNPINSTLGAYPLCAHINILDRSAKQTVNRDPAALLPASQLDSVGPANRFYMVQIVNRQTLAVRSDLCGQDPGTTTPGVNESYLVTVGVTWLEKVGPNTNTKRVVVSTIIT